MKRLFRTKSDHFTGTTQRNPIAETLLQRWQGKTEEDALDEDRYEWKIVPSESVVPHQSYA